MKTATYTTYSESDYLAYEAQSPVRHEYIAGEIFAMTGASIRHNVIAGNLFAELRTHLKGSPCRALIEGVKLRLRKEQSYFYPDVMLTSEDRLQELNSLQQIIEAQVEIYRPHGDICWGIITDEPGDTVEIASLEIKLGMDEIYFESGIAC